MAQPNIPPPTIPTLKLTFLDHQLLLLSQPLRPSPSLSTASPLLRQKTIDEALLKLNSQAQKHHKMVFAPQARRHVAEQIWRLYWGEAERVVVRGEGMEGEWTGWGRDLCAADVIASLPATWEESPSDANVDVDEAEREKRTAFTLLRLRLKELDERRKMMREKVERYQALKGLLDPFENAEESVQPNLVVKRGEMEMELERMKMLLLRLKRGMAGLGERRAGLDEGDGNNMEGLEEEGIDGKVARLLDGS